jgi:hypothetical protein
MFILTLTLVIFKGFGGGRKPFGRRGGGAAGGGVKRERGPKKSDVTIDQLNAELDAYTMQS